MAPVSSLSVLAPARRARICQCQSVSRGEQSAASNLYLSEYRIEYQSRTCVQVSIYLSHMSSDHLSRLFCRDLGPVAQFHQPTTNTPARSMPSASTPLGQYQSVHFPFAFPFLLSTAISASPHPYSRPLFLFLFLFSFLFSFLFLLLLLFTPTSHFPRSDAPSLARPPAYHLSTVSLSFRTTMSSTMPSVCAANPCLWGSEPSAQL